jgi:hypothetical protein
MKNNAFILGLIGALVFAHQPVMDMAPRWNGGYGFQVRYERFGSDLTIHEQNILSRYFQQTYWLEGVYTWHRAKTLCLSGVAQDVAKAVKEVKTKSFTLGFNK